MRTLLSHSYAAADTRERVKVRFSSRHMLSPMSTRAPSRKTAELEVRDAGCGGYPRRQPGHVSFRLGQAEEEGVQPAHQTGSSGEGPPFPTAPMCTIPFHLSPFMPSKLRGGRSSGQELPAALHGIAG